MLGASGAVGGEALKVLQTAKQVTRLTLLGRRNIDLAPNSKLTQHAVDIFKPASYAPLLSGHDAAVCTLGVGQPGKMGKDEFLRIDKTAVIDFASACKTAGVRHFELLSAVGANARSASFYLRTKGELQDALIALKFERLSLFQPSMILTPGNRYGFQQALTLAIWPKLSPLLAGPLRPYRGVKVEVLGAAMANNLFTSGLGTEYLKWDQFLPGQASTQPCFGMKNG
jgi:uncharacterized protein YbjT (DUF2867 family)